MRSGWSFRQPWRTGKRSMLLERLPPDDPREWPNRAHSNLAKAQGGSKLREVYLEDLCFDAQQAAEKAIKAVLIHLHVRFPYVHDLARLLSLAEEAGALVPENVRWSVALTDFAVAARYPGPGEPVSLEEYREALRMASQVIEWAEEVIAAEGA